MITIKNESQIQKMRDAGVLLHDVLKMGFVISAVIFTACFNHGQQCTCCGR